MKTPVKIALACSGIGHVNRGYEASVLDVFETISKSFHQVRLFRGGRAEDRGDYCPTIKRSSRLYRTPPFSWVSIYRRYWLENFLFTIPFLLRISLQPVDLIFTPDHVLAGIVNRYRKFIPGHPAVIFSNGAPFENSFCRQFHYVHQKSKAHFNAEDAPNTKMFLIGNGFDISAYQESPDFDRINERKRMGLPIEKTIILCLSALNSGHKRVDWIIKEAQNLDESYHLVLCGEESSETPALKNLARNFSLSRTFMRLPMSEVPNLIKTCDLMVLGSLSEGFPRVIGEAMASRIPILVHPHENARWILGEESDCFVDMTKAGELATMIKKWANGGGPGIETIESNYEKVKNEYSREHVFPQYLEMFEWVGRQRIGPK